ncbi:hypothetical protein ACMS1V_000006 [Cronobacter dublinensis]
MDGSEIGQGKFIQQHGIDMASCADAQDSASCQKAKNERDAVGLALAKESVASLTVSTQVMWGLGAIANAGIGYMADGTIDQANAAIAGWVNVFSMGNGLLGTVGWNAAGGALGNCLDDKDPLSGAISNGTGAAFGYGLGKSVSWATNKGTNWWKGVWDPKYNAALRAYTEVKGDFGILKEMPPSNIPGFFGDVGSSVSSETTGKGAETVVNKVKEKYGKK